MILTSDEINKQSNTGEAYIYPNPALTYFSISNTNLINDKNANLKIYNMFGQEVMSKNGINNKINISQLPGGIYIVMIVSDNKQYTAKLLINR
jgi:hypothetical protein